MASCLIAASLADWILRGSHVPDLSDEWLLATRAIGDALFWGATIWLVYLALEPSVRRHYPHVLVSWNRLLRGADAMAAFR